MLEGKETEEISTGFQSDTTYQCKPRVKISSGGGHKRAAEQKVESSNCVGGQMKREVRADGAIDRSADGRPKRMDVAGGVVSYVAAAGCRKKSPGAAKS